MKHPLKLLCLLSLVLFLNFGIVGCASTNAENDVATNPNNIPATTFISIPQTIPSTVSTTGSITTTVPDQTVHIHIWKAATCAAPKTCLFCSNTEGVANGHTWIDATCTDPRTCATCGATEGTALGHTWTDATCTVPRNCTSCNKIDKTAKQHNYVQGLCTDCKATDPNYITPLVWIPTKRGTKYHSNPTCSKMIDPKLITKSEAISQGFDPCRNCYKEQ